MLLELLLLMDILKKSINISGYFHTPTLKMVALLHSPCLSGRQFFPQIHTSDFLGTKQNNFIFDQQLDSDLQLYVTELYILVPAWENYTSSLIG